MMRAALVTAILLAACGGGGQSPEDSDALLVDADEGSGSDAVFDEGADPSPPDVTLQWVVVVLSAVIVLGPVRRRKHDEV